MDFSLPMATIARFKRGDHGATRQTPKLQRKLHFWKANSVALERIDTQLGTVHEPLT
jgi:hypothetical protein